MFANVYQTVPLGSRQEAGRQPTAEPLVEEISDRPEEGGNEPDRERRQTLQIRYASKDRNSRKSAVSRGWHAKCRPVAQYRRFWFGRGSDDNQTMVFGDPGGCGHSDLTERDGRSRCP